MTDRFQCLLCSVALGASLVACGSTEGGAVHSGDSGENNDTSGSADVALDALDPLDLGSGEDASAGDDAGTGIDAGGDDTGTGVDTSVVDTGTGVDTGLEDTGTGVDTSVETGVEDTGTGVDTSVEDTGTGLDTGVEPPPWLGGAPNTVGPYPTTRLDVEIPLPSRTVNAEIHRPTSDADAPFPVVVFNHGFQLAGEDFRTYGERLASHGIVAILPTMGDSLLGALTHAELRDIQIELDDWIVVQATRRGADLDGWIDPSLLGVGGHSRGGKQSMLAAGIDDRIAATFNVDPVDSGPPFGGGGAADYPSAAPESASAMSIPSGYIGAGRSATGTLGQACAPVGENYHEFYAASPSPSREWFLPNAGHNDFVVTCDFICSFACTAGDDPAAALQFAITTTVAFYKYYLGGDPSYLPWLESSAAGGWPAGTTYEHR